MNEKSILKRNMNIIIDAIEGELIVYDKMTQNTHILNEIAGFLLENANNLTAEQVINKLYFELSCDEQKIHPKEEVFDDCMACIKEMISYGLLYEF